MVPDPVDFDAVAAAKELDDLLGDRGNDAGYVAGLEKDVEELNALLAKKEAELAAANRRADQAQAEIEAAGKRIASASAKELEQKTRKLLESFLPVIDDLDRGIAAARQVAESADVVEGLELAEPAQDGRVIDVMREGYLIGDETLRPAGVAVGKLR